MKRAFAFGFAATLLAATVPISAATFTVTNTFDSGPGSLREAILNANGTPGNDDIAFAIPSPGVQTIVLASPLPPITQAVLIDGFTQPGSSVNTQPVRPGPQRGPAGPDRRHGSRRRALLPGLRR